VNAIDLNADVGEGYPNDAALYAIVTSANVACGGHAGDAHSMAEAVRGALRYGVAIGAHPSYPDRAGFGRAAADRTPDEIYGDVAEQTRALAAVAREHGARLRHVKPHGALYNLSARDATIAAAIARAVRDVDPSLALYGLAGSASIRAARDAGLRAVEEAFPDRGYAPDGTLLPRTEPGALIENSENAERQAIALARRGAQTLCIHGDGPHAVEFAHRIRAALERDGITLAPP
jgi:UPF0271 protein